MKIMSGNHGEREHIRIQERTCHSCVKNQKGFYDFYDYYEEKQSRIKNIASLFTDSPVGREHTTHNCS
jgi:hypothetical protein